MKETIVNGKLKEILVVFLTDGTNSDKDTTRIESKELEIVLDKVYSKFNVIGCGEDFDV